MGEDVWFSILDILLVAICGSGILFLGVGVIVAITEDLTTPKQLRLKQRYQPILDYDTNCLTTLNVINNLRQLISINDTKGIEELVNDYYNPFESMRRYQDLARNGSHYDSLTELKSSIETVIVDIHNSKYVELKYLADEESEILIKSHNLNK